MIPSKGNSKLNGRLLTPEEGCGYSKVMHKRIVGGAPAKNGTLKYRQFIFHASSIFRATSKFSELRILKFRFVLKIQVLGHGWHYCFINRKNCSLNQNMSVVKIMN